ncbi:MAG: D-glycero-beta-D-manno-heptose 1-phosphate adenylyltransferase [Candidatus Omnitrophota bacterium]
MNTHRKIVNVKTLKRILPAWKKRGRTIAFTNGCFDLLHVGHIDYLEKSKKLNRILVVGLNSDASVKKIKGHKRPINSQNNRARVLAALSCVDYVVIFHEADPYRLVQALKPDVLIKGADWKNKKVIGNDIVRALHGKVELIKYLKGYSTTNLIRLIRTKCKE